MQYLYIISLITVLSCCSNGNIKSCMISYKNCTDSANYDCDYNIKDYLTDFDQKEIVIKNSLIKTTNKSKKRYSYNPDKIIKNASQILIKNNLSIENKYINKNHIKTVIGYYRRICNVSDCILINDIRDLIYTFYNGITNEEISDLGLKSKSAFMKSIIKSGNLDLLIRFHNMGYIYIDEDFPFFKNVKLLERILNYSEISSKIDIPIVLAHYINILYSLQSNLRSIGRGNKFKTILKITSDFDNIPKVLSLMICYLARNKSKLKKSSLLSVHINDERFFTYEKSLEDLIKDYNDECIFFSPITDINIDFISELFNEASLTSVKNNMSLCEKASYYSGYNILKDAYNILKDAYNNLPNLPVRFILGLSLLLFTFLISALYLISYLIPSDELFPLVLSFIFYSLMYYFWFLCFRFYKPQNYYYRLKEYLSSKRNN